MTDSLTVSILLFVGLAIGAVVVRDVWRAWRLRRLAVHDNPPISPAREGGTADRQSGADLVRGEPTLGLIGPLSDQLARPEPRLPGEDPNENRPLPAAQDTPPWAADRTNVGAAPADEPASENAPGPVLAPQHGSAGETPFEYLDSRPLAGGVDRARGVATAPTVPRVSAGAAEMSNAHAASPGVASVSAAAGQSVPEGAASGSTISERTDCVALLRFVQRVPAERLVSLGQALRRSGSKPVMLEVLGAQAVVEGWHTPRAGEGCSAARFGLLLANRAGPLNALEYTDFAQRIREVAAALGVGIEIADMAGTLARARALDAEGARLDAQVCINVDATEALGPSQLAALAGPLSVVERGNNRYARLGPRGETLFSVSLGERPNRLGFLLDVPRVDPTSRPFAAMIECVRITAMRLPGRIIDDGGKALSERSIETIAREVDDRCASLAAAGLSAGSAAALRVFN